MMSCLLRFSLLFMPPLRLAYIHRPISLFQSPAGFGMRAEQRDAGRYACRGGATAEHEAQAVDGLFQHRRLGMGVGFAEMPQQQRKLVASEPANHIANTHLTL